MVTAEIKQTLLGALEIARGDSLERVESAYRQYTPEQMQEQHGRSGLTRQQILDSYREHRACMDAAKAWVLTLAVSP